MPTESNEKKHKQVPITDRDGDTVFEVDEGIHALIQYLYDKGVKTFNSCEDNFDGEDSVQIAWIQFSLDAWMGITSMAFNGNSRELFEFINFACNVDLRPFDDAYIDEDDEIWGGDNLLWTASVRFNREYLAEFEQLLQETLGGS